MTLSPGTRLGRYEITTSLGEGGMGHVYRAVDTELRREVAVKVMTDRFIGRADLRDRFRTEALAIAALNHPNICAIYDAGCHDQIDYMVMEIVDGVTLAARLRRRRLPVDEALKIARDIASALGAAHRAGIVHRDVKPSNIMLSRSGAKLLDFGVASVVPAGTLASEITVTPKNLTGTGTPIGTWRYMAPEQLRGDRVDSRSDVFALGAVLFEMVMGRAAFDGATHQELVAAILESTPPPLNTLVPEASSALAQVVRVCLEKSPDDRWQAGGDVQRALTLVGTAGSGRAPAMKVNRLAATAAAVAVALIGFAVGSLPPRSTPAVAAPSVIRAAIPTAAPVPVANGSLAFSPDGRTIVYRNALSLVRYDVATGVSSMIDGTDNGRAPFFSPDGQWLGFAGPSHLMKMPVSGGNTVRIVESRDKLGASWGDDGFIVYGGRYGSGLMRVNANGGDPEAITTIQRGEEGEDHRYPQVLPGGRRVLFAVGTGPEPSAKIVAIDLDTRLRKDLIHGSFAFRYVATGHLAYTIRGVLYAAPFDASRLEITGAPIKLAEGVEDWEGNPEFEFAANGDFIYQTGRAGVEPQNEMVLVNLEGEVRSIGPRGAFVQPRFSPDGTRIAVMRLAAKNNAWIYDLARDTMTQVTRGSYFSPLWTRDQKLTMQRGRPGSFALVVRRADSTGQDEVLVAEPGGGVAESWTPDGKTLITSWMRSGFNSDILTVERGGAPQVHIATPRDEYNARLSPDGRLLSYIETEGTGPPQLIVEHFPDRADRTLVTSEPTTFAAWSPDSRRLYYRRFAAPDSPVDTLWAVDVLAQAPLRLGPPRRLFTVPGASGTFDVSPDGKQFVMIRPPSQEPRRLQIVFNRLANLK